MAFATIKRGPFGYTPAWKLVFLALLMVIAVVVAVSMVCAVAAGVAAEMKTAPTAQALSTASEPTSEAVPDTAGGNGTAVEEEVVDEPSAPVSDRYFAVLTCRIHGMEYQVSACLVGSGDNASGSLKVTSGSSVRQYSDIEIMQAFPDRRARIELESSFDVIAQTSSLDGAVLRLEVEDRTGHSLYADEAGSMGVLNASS